MSMSNTDKTIRTGADRTSVGIGFPPTSRTKQEFRDECDINNVVAQHVLTGQFTHVAAAMPSYGDFSNVEDYQTAANQILQADLAFAQLPAKVRKRMQNSPEVFLEFMADADNQAEAIELGLAEAPKKPEETGEVTPEARAEAAAAAAAPAAAAPAGEPVAGTGGPAGETPPD